MKMHVKFEEIKKTRINLVKKIKFDIITFGKSLWFKTLHENKNFRLTKICEKDRRDHIFISFRIFAKYHIF